MSGDESAEAGPASEPARQTCYRCGADLPGGVTKCPQCGRHQTRRCYCGREIPVTAAECPHCGADWSLALRVRRKTHSRHVNWKRLAAYAVTGALATLLLAAIANSLVGGLATRSLPVGQRGLPADFPGRLAMAFDTVRRNLGFLMDRMAGVGGGPLALVGLLSLGAGVGAVIYLGRSGTLRLRWPIRSPKARRRRRARRL